MATVNVNSITINNSSGSYGYGPFYSNKTIKTVDLSYAPWTNNSMVNAFSYCYNLTSVANINQNITNIYYAFVGCNKLVNAPVIPNSVTNMSTTFAACENLVNAPIIPNSVTDMTWTFQGCNRLVNAPVIPNGVTNMYNTFQYCTNLVNVPDMSTTASVTNMGQTFDSCNKLVNAPIIPGSVTNMYGTFNRCNSLVNAPIIPGSVTNMYGTFNYCTNLTGDIYIQSSSINGANYCFYGTTNQKNVYIPFNSSLGIYTDTYNAFNKAGYNATTIKNGVTIKENPYFTMYNNQFWYDTKFGGIGKIMNVVGNVVIPNNINGTTITSVNCNGSFSSNSLITSVDFNNINIIGGNMAQAFWSCTNLLSVTNVPNNVTNMYMTFYMCYNLADVPTIPNSVTAMRYTFGFCNNLVNAPEIPNSVTSMQQIFYSCSKLTGNIYIHSNKITDVSQCFESTNASLTKNVYIPFTYENGVNTATYNAFITAGYTTTGSRYGVYLMDSGEH